MRKDNTTQKRAITPQNDREKVFRAMYELLHNPETPLDLYEAVASFACTQSNECRDDDFYHSEPALTAILDTVPDSERRGAIRAARESEEVSHAAN